MAGNVPVMSEKKIPPGRAMRVRGIGRWHNKLSLRKQPLVLTELILGIIYSLPPSPELVRTDKEDENVMVSTGTKYGRVTHVEPIPHPGPDDMVCECLIF